MRHYTSLVTLALLSACGSSHPPVRATPPPPPPAALDASVPPAAVPEALDTGRLPPLARPVRYALELTVDPAQTSYQGTVRIDLDVPAPTRVLVLHARGQTLDLATVTFGGQTLTAHTAARMAHGGREHPEELVVTLDREIPAGAATLTLGFHADYNTGLRGLYRVRVADDWYAFTDFEPTDARRAFPCFDEPGLKAPFQVTVTVPAGSVAIQNMPETGRSTNPDGSIVFRFAPTPPLSSYLIAVAVGPFDFFQGPQSPVPIRVVTPRGRSALGSLAAEAAGAHLAILSEYFDRPYPYPKLDLVSVADFGPGAMENPGMITYRDSLLLLDSTHVSSRARLAMASVTAHELAHQWFGDLVTMAWWDDLWLNEGFATWMSTVVMDRWRPALGVRIDTVRGRGWARELDSRPGAHAIRRQITSTSEAMEAFDSTTYDKGAALIAMIEAWMTPERFRQGIRAYIRAHAESNATAADLLRALTEAGGRDIPAIADSFLDQPGLPRVHVEMTCSAGHPARVTLRQSRFAPHGANEGTAAQTWTLPVCLGYPTAGGPREYCTLLATQEHSVDLEGSDCPAWIAPNAQHAGHYWYDLTPAQFRALWTRREALDPAGRIELLANLDSLLQGSVIGADLYLEALSALLTDPDPHVLDAAVASLGMVETTLLPDAARPAFQRWVASRLRPIAQRLTFTPAPSDDDLRRGLRRSVLGALGMLTDDPWVLTESNRVAAQYLRDPTSVDGDIGAVALAISARRADAPRFEALLAAVNASTTPQTRSAALGALTSVENPALQTRALDLALATTTRQQDLRGLLGRRSHTPAMRTLAARWTVDHFTDLMHRWNNNGRAIGGHLAGFCDAAMISQAESAVNPRLHEMEGVDRIYRALFEADRQCVTTHAREAQRVAAFFLHPR